MSKLLQYFVDNSVHMATSKLEIQQQIAKLIRKKRPENMFKKIMKTKKTKKAHA